MKTEWIDASVYPVRMGRYEYYDALNKKVVMLAWRGPNFRWGPRVGLHMRGDKWRGLTKDGFIQLGGKP